MKLAAEKKAVSFPDSHLKNAKSREESFLLKEPFGRALRKGNEGAEKPAIGCGSIVKERNESGPAAP